MSAFFWPLMSSSFPFWQALVVFHFFIKNMGNVKALMSYHSSNCSRGFWGLRDHTTEAVSASVLFLSFLIVFVILAEPVVSPVEFSWASLMNGHSKRTMWIRISFNNSSAFRARGPCSTDCALLPEGSSLSRDPNQCDSQSWVRQLEWC